MGVGFQFDPELGHRRDVEVTVDFAIRQAQRVYCQNEFPSYIIQNLANADKIKNFFKDWLYVRAYINTSFKILNLKHKSLQILYCVAEDGKYNREKFLENK